MILNVRWKIKTGDWWLYSTRFNESRKFDFPNYWKCLSRKIICSLKLIKTNLKKKSVYFVKSFTNIVRTKWECANSPLASSPNSSLPICISRTRGTSPSISSDSRWTLQAPSTCARPRWCCRSTVASHLANNRIFRRLVRSRRRSPDPSRTSRWTCPPRRRTCKLSDTSLSPCCSGTTWLPDSPTLPASSRSNLDAPTGPRWLPASVCPRYCRKRPPCCSTRLEGVWKKEYSHMFSKCDSSC